MPRVALRRVNLAYPVVGASKRLLAGADADRIGAIGRGLVGVNALRDIDLVADDGNRIGILGGNGSGKTTLLRVIAGVYPPQSGSVRVRGRLSSMLDIHTGFDPDATGAENIAVRGLFLGAARGDVPRLRDEIIAFSELGPYIDLPMRTYSAGMRMRLAFSIATAVTPDILVMDEWLSAGDAAFRRKAEARMTSLVAESRVLFMASHSSALLTKVCTRGIVLNEGRIVFDGSIEEAIAIHGLGVSGHAVSGEALPPPRREALDRDGMHQRRYADLTAIRDAVDAYRAETGAYPDTQGRWVTDRIRVGLGREWVPGIAPRFIASVPVDPEVPDADDEAQYRYKSNGTDFKLVAFRSRDLDLLEASGRADLRDPARPGWAWGYWTPSWADT
ncbi:ABC transporter ATP-binding protein [Salinarimonas sp.]|uniref:ABC transporter ATP-binding protein n=1 Tax=Salinarimonas sp. TaxID=2766526 RepID=UPI0032D992BB